MDKKIKLNKKELIRKQDRMESKLSITEFKSLLKSEVKEYLDTDKDVKIWD